MRTSRSKSDLVLAEEARRDRIAEQAFREIADELEHAIAGSGAMDEETRACLWNVLTLLRALNNRVWRLEIE